MNEPFDGSFGSSAALLADRIELGYYLQKTA
jgi:hypothetical protein